MSKPRVRHFFIPLCLIALAIAIIAIWMDRDREWKHYQRTYYKTAAAMATDPEIKKQILASPLEIKQIQTLIDRRVDRCTTCHLGVDNPNFMDMEPPYQTHPKLQDLSRMLHHSLDEFGCSFCHDGQGLATTTEAAHGRVPFWDRPLLTYQWLEVACGRCHKGVLELEGAPVLSRGRTLIKQVGCYNCHKMEGFEQEEPGKFSPDLTTVGTKINKKWLPQWLKDPFAGKAKTRMLNFYLSDADAGALTEFLMTLTEKPPAGAEEKALNPLAAEGKKLFKDLRCFFCHPMEGFKKENMAPDLTGFGNKNVLDLDFGLVRDIEVSLRGWTLKKISEPRSFETKENKLEMPGNDLSDDELVAITILLLGFTGEKVPKAYRRVEHFGDNVGKRLFDELSCVGCHNVSRYGIMSTNVENVARDLSTIGDKIKVPWMFQWLKDPSSIYPDTKMPTVGTLTENQVLQLTTYTMSFRQEKGQEVSLTDEEMAAGEISRDKVLAGRKQFEIMECYRCHRIAGKGGQIAPELTRVGEKIRKDWLLDWFTKPENYNLNMLDTRPIVLSAQQIDHLVSYLLSLRQGSALPPRIPKGALMIKEEKEEDLDELEKARALFGEAGPVKYLFGKRVGKMGLGCYGCHRLGHKGSDIGPDLNEEGDKVKREWLIRWFKDPESHIPGATMGDFHLTDNEIKILTDYLMTFKRETAKAVAQPQKNKASWPRG